MDAMQEKLAGIPAVIGFSALMLTVAVCLAIIIWAHSSATASKLIWVIAAIFAVFGAIVAVFLSPVFGFVCSAIPYLLVSAVDKAIKS